MNCTFQCPYPTYGMNCQDIYNYSDEPRGVSTGCNFGTTDNVHLFFSRSIY